MRPLVGLSTRPTRVAFHAIDTGSFGFAAPSLMAVQPYRCRDAKSDRFQNKLKGRKEGRTTTVHANIIPWGHKTADFVALGFQDSDEDEDEEDHEE